MGTYDELTGSGVDFAALLEEEKKDDSQNNGYSVPSSPVEETQIIFATADKKKKNNLLNNDYLSKSFDRGYLKDNKQDSLQRQILMPSKSLTHIGGSLKKRNVHHSVSDMSLGNQKKLSDSVMSIPELDIMVGTSWKLDLTLSSCVGTCLEIRIAARRRVTNFIIVMKL